MRRPKTQIYMIPNMGMSVDVFEGLVVTNKDFKQWYLPWFTPSDGETLESYAAKMLARVKHPKERCILLGLGFGGILAQEMSKLANFKKIVIVSSYKSIYELSPQMKRIIVAQQFELIANKLLNNEDIRIEFLFGKTGLKNKDRFLRYFYNFDKVFFKWAIIEMLSWRQSEPIYGILHIQGALDGVLPINNIKNCIVVPNGTHALIPLKSTWFNEHLLNLIQGNPLQYNYEER